MSSVRLRNKSNLGNLSISETYFSVLSLSFVFFSVKFNPFLLLILSTEMKCFFFVLPRLMLTMIFIPYFLCGILKYFEIFFSFAAVNKIGLIYNE